jgi:hypothetical protein
MARALGIQPRRHYLRESAFGVPQIVENDLPDTGNVRFALWIHFRRRKRLEPSTGRKVTHVPSVRLNHPDLAGSPFQPSRDRIPDAHVTDYSELERRRWEGQTAGSCI